MEKIKKYWLEIIGSIIMLICLYYVVIFLNNLFNELYINSKTTECHEIYGSFGSYVGGIIGAIIGFVTLFFVYLTYTSQRKELKLQRDLIAQQQFESTFFNMLNVHRELKNNLSIQNPNENITGTNVFKIIKHKYDTFFKRSYFKGNDGYITAKYVGEMEGTKEEFQNKFYADYDKFYKEFQFILNHYCINIYHILKFINDNEEKDVSKNRVEKYKKYANIFKSQLDIDEVFILKWTLIHINEENNNLDIIKLIKHYNFLFDNNNPDIKNNRKFHDFDIK